jgi:hypothetical protein
MNNLVLSLLCYQRPSPGFEHSSWKDPFNIIFQFVAFQDVDLISSCWIEKYIGYNYFYDLMKPVNGLYL